MEKTINVWFKAKDYGYGWYPSSWQGWLVLAIFLVALSINAALLDAGNLTYNQTVLIAVQNLLLIIWILATCFVTGEKATWRWGKKKTNAEIQK